MSAPEQPFAQRPAAAAAPAALFSLAGRVAIVTGGAGPLGGVLADTLAAAGAEVVVVDRDPAACEAVAAAIAERHGVAAHPLGADLLVDDAPARVVAEVLQRCGRIDAIVNNAAFTGTSGVPGYAVPFDQQTDEAWDLAMRLNLRVPFAFAREARAALIASGHGVIVNVSSIYGLVGPNMGLYEGTVMGNPAAYAGSKGGVAQLTRYLSTVLAPAVRVNAVAPGGIARGQADQFVGRYERLTPLGRMGTEDDFRGVLTWLVSDASAWVTGQVVAVDGGWTAW